MKREEAPAHLHPRGAALVEVDGARIGSFGPIHPDVIDALALDGEVLVGELDIEAFLGGPKLPKYTAIPRFPASTRDIALVVKDGVPAGDVERAVREAAGTLAADVRIFDRFVGGQVPAGCASLAFHVVYRAPDKTLTDAEVDAAHANVVKVVGEKFGATLRQ
jgi:phenylalanyl-tRNA synthetase beta chain